MKRNYPAMKRVARIAMIAAVFTVLIGGIVAFLSASASESPMMAFGIAVGSGIVGLFTWAGAEMILVQANLGEDVGKLASYAERFEKRMSSNERDQS